MNAEKIDELFSRLNPYKLQLWLQGTQLGPGWLPSDEAEYPLVSELFSLGPGFDRAAELIRLEKALAAESSLTPEVLAAGEAEVKRLQETYAELKVLITPELAQFELILLKFGRAFLREHDSAPIPTLKSALAQSYTSKDMLLYLRRLYGVADTAVIDPKRDEIREAIELFDVLYC